MLNEQILQLTDELVRIPSVSGDVWKNDECIDFVHSYFDNISNARIQKIYYENKPSLIVSNFDWRWSDVVLNGHVDVVPANDQHQFEPLLDWNLLYWRWAGDMKSGIAIMTLLMKQLLEENYSKKVSLIITSDEEVGWGNWVWSLTKDWYWWDVVLIPDWWTTNQIVVCQKWIMIFSVKAYGKSCHSSRPWLWENAIDNLIRLYELLKNFFENPKKLYWPDNWWCSVNMNIISAGLWKNVIPDSAEATFDIRFTEDFTNNYVIDKIQELVKMCNSEISDKIFGSLLATDEKDDIVQKFYQTVKNELPDSQVDLIKEHGWSDWRFFAEAWAKVLLQRPECGNLHWKDEWVNIDTFLPVYNSFYNFLKSL